MKPTPKCRQFASKYRCISVFANCFNGCESQQIWSCNKQQHRGSNSADINMLSFLGCKMSGPKKQRKMFGPGEWTFRGHWWFERRQAWKCRHGGHHHFVMRPEPAVPTSWNTSFLITAHGNMHSDSNPYDYLPFFYTPVYKNFLHKKRLLHKSVIFEKLTKQLFHFYSFIALVATKLAILSSCNLPNPFVSS